MSLVSHLPISDQTSHFRIGQRGICEKAHVHIFGFIEETKFFGRGRYTSLFLVDEGYLIHPVVSPAQFKLGTEIRDGADKRPASGRFFGRIIAFLRNYFAADERARAKKR